MVMEVLLPFMTNFEKTINTIALAMLRSKALLTSMTTNAIKTVVGFISILPS